MIETPQERVHPVQLDVNSPEAPARAGLVFWRLLRDNTPMILAWGTGYSFLIVLVVVLYPILEENNMLLDVIRGLGMLDVFEENYNIDLSGLTTFPGYLALEALGWTPTVLTVFTLPQAIGAVMGEEQRGTLDLLMSTPLRRWQFLLEKTAAIFASLLGILGMMWVTLVVSSILVGVEITLSQTLIGIWHIIPISAVFICVTLFLSVTFRSPRTALGLAAAYVFFSFFSNVLGDAVDVPLLRFFQQFGAHAYYSSVEAMLNFAPRWETEAAMLLASAVFLALAVWRFQKRDLMR
ncbi:MAG: hypothetical protein OHK0046_15620 [Anaerolineae bacterium]